jgi:hypothetical protein
MEDLYCSFLKKNQKQWPCGALILGGSLKADDTFDQALIYTHLKEAVGLFVFEDATFEVTDALLINIQLFVPEHGFIVIAMLIY